MPEVKTLPFHKSDGWVYPGQESRTAGTAGSHPLKVGVLVDIERNGDPSGHVRSWERFGKAAGSHPELDLTVHFLARQKGTEEIAPNVRFIKHTPLISSRFFDKVETSPGHTDLAPFCKRILPYLPNYEVIHSTDGFFAQARTALRFARKHRVPLVNSLHTDIPSYTRIFLEDAVHRLAGRGALARLLLDRLRLQERIERMLLRRLHRYFRGCHHVLAATGEEVDALRSVVPGGRTSILRRGIDKDTFHPRRRDRGKLLETYGIPVEKFLLIFVGRLDAAKNVATAAHSAKLLADRGKPVHLILVGDGAQRKELEEVLGERATFTGGRVPHALLAWIYASSDLFIFPSETEVSPNVVLEAKACGLPVLLSTNGGAPERVKKPGLDGFLVEGQDPAEWARVVETFIESPERLRSAGSEARLSIERDWPSWEEVLASDLIPVWQEVRRAAVV